MILSKVLNNIDYEVIESSNLNCDIKNLTIDSRRVVSGSMFFCIKGLHVDGHDFIKDAIDHATDAISGGLGGYVVFTLNADDQPQEILIMDTDDINTAVNVWRFNKNGLGHSHNGYRRNPSPYRLL